MSPARLCVIGNSHVASLKLAQSEAGLPAGLPPVDYFAASANRIAELRLRKGRYLAMGAGKTARQIAAVSGGRERIDLHDYDAFTLVGICLQPRDLLRVFRSHCLWRHRAWAAGRPLLGDTAFAEILRGLYRYRPAYRLAGEIAAVRPGVPVFLLPAPCPAPGFLGEKGARAFAALRDTPYLGEIAGLHRAAAAAAARAAGARPVFQRAATLAAPGLTDPRFTLGAVGIGERPESDAWQVEKAPDDPWHMNAAFGRLRLQDLAEALAAAARAA